MGNKSKRKLKVSVHFLFSSFLVGTLVLIMIYNCWPREAPEGLYMAALKPVELYTGEQGGGGYIREGDSVRILGQISNRAVGTMSFWVETSDGRRGYAPQEAFDDRFVVYSTGSRDSSLSVGVGDTVTVVSRTDDELFPRVVITTPDGEKEELAPGQAISVTGSRLENYCLGDRTGYFLSKEKFERLYLGKTQEETDALYRKALFVRPVEGGMEAFYGLYIFDKEDGRFYNARLRFEDGRSVSYTLEPYSSKHDWILRYLPWADKILDVDLFSMQISGNPYQRIEFSDSTGSVWHKVWDVALAVVFLVLFLYWLFCTCHLVLFALLALLECHRLFSFVGDKVLAWIFILIDLPFTYAWLVLGLCYYFQWWYFVPGLLVVARAVWRMVPEFTEARCPGCCRMDSVVPDRQEVVREYNEWRERSYTSVTGESQKKWKEFVRKTTTYRDGHKTHEDSDVKYYTETTTNTRTNVYNVLYHVTKYRQYYRCPKCGFEISAEREHLKELDSRYKGSHKDTSVQTTDQFGNVVD